MSHYFAFPKDRRHILRNDIPKFDSTVDGVYTRVGQYVVEYSRPDVLSFPSAVRLSVLLARSELASRLQSSG